jgi:hypothetical protein
MRCCLLLLAVPCLAFAPVPFPKPKKPMRATEVVVQAVGGLEHIDLTCGTTKVSVKLDAQWRENLAACMKRFRQGNPALRRVVLRCDIKQITPLNYISLRRICYAAAYPELRLEEDAPR